MDVTDQWIRENTPDPLYHPLSPTVGKIEDEIYFLREGIAERLGLDLEEMGELWEMEISEYDHNLEYQGNQITLEWATNELKGYQTSWVCLGLVADRVRRYRLYQGKYADWNTYCKEILGKQNWQINKIIKAAKAFITLLQEGFAILPTCVSQAEKLLDCCKKSGNLLSKSWEIVVERLHEPQLITAKSICEVLGFPMEHKNKISRNQRERIRELADRDGMTFDEKLDELLKLDENPQEQEEELEDDPKLMELKEQLWHRDLNQLIEEHDRQLWFLGTIMKLFDWQPKVSQFHWLRQARCQV